VKILIIGLEFSFCSSQFFESSLVIVPVTQQSRLADDSYQGYLIPRINLPKTKHLSPPRLKRRQNLPKKLKKIYSKLSIQARQPGNSSQSESDKES
jgi:hypothetical protein